LQYMERRWRDGYIQGLINSFLEGYDPDEPGIAILRQRIHRRLVQYNGHRTNLNLWKKHNNLLFIKDSHVSLAKWLFDRPPWDYSTFEKLGFRESLFRCSYLNHMAKSLIDLVAAKFPDRLGEMLSFLELNGIKLELMSRDLAREAATKFLPLAGIEAPNKVKGLLRSFFLRHLSDPRIAGGRVKWTRVPKDAQNIFTTWLSKDDLEFFFNIVDKTCEEPDTWKYRRDFWKAYLPHIHFTRVVLGSNATRIIQTPQMKRYIKERSPSRLKGAGSGQSVFIIGLGNRRFIEWSNSGACRVWSIKDLPFSQEDELYSATDFRSTCEKRFIHNRSDKYKWQEELESWIERNVLGMKPGEFYKLSGKFDMSGAPHKAGKAKSEPSTSRKARQAKSKTLKKPTCPRCGNAMVKKTGQYGPFWGCNSYPFCRATMSI